MRYEKRKKKNDKQNWVILIRKLKLKTIYLKSLKKWMKV
mgnify:CR=1 FL=1